MQTIITKVCSLYREEFGSVSMDLEWLGVYWTECHPEGFVSYDDFQDAVLKVYSEGPAECPTCGAPADWLQKHYPDKVLFMSTQGTWECAECWLK